MSEGVVWKREATLEMARYTLHRFGVSGCAKEIMLQKLRERVEMEQLFEPLHQR